MQEKLSGATPSSSITSTPAPRPSDLAARTAGRPRLGILGIDPGLKGGIALVWSGGSMCWNLPETEHEMADLIGRIQNGAGPREEFPVRPRLAVIEYAKAMPKMAVMSVFKFAENYGVLLGILAASKIPFEKVAPGKWQRDMRCLSRGDKAVTRRRAQELYPLLKPTNRTADALLIATWGLRSRRELDLGGEAG